MKKKVLFTLAAVFALAVCLTFSASGTAPVFAADSVRGSAQGAQIPNGTEYGKYVAEVTSVTLDVGNSVPSSATVTQYEAEIKNAFDKIVVDYNSEKTAVSFQTKPFIFAGKSSSYINYITAYIGSGSGSAKHMDVTSRDSEQRPAAFGLTQPGQVNYFTCVYVIYINEENEDVNKPKNLYKTGEDVFVVTIDVELVSFTPEETTDPIDDPTDDKTDDQTNKQDKKSEPASDSAAQEGAIPLTQLTAKGKTSLAICWEKTQGADGYDIFFARCNHNGKKNALMNVMTIEGNNTFTWTNSGLKEGTPYKVYVKAYVLKNGKKDYISTSPEMHVYTSGGNKKYTNAKSVKVNRKNVSLKTGKTYRLKARVRKLEKGKRLMPKSHAPKLRYLSTDTKVASVSKRGKIKGVGKGTCDVYVFAHNGVFKKVKVTVK